MARSLLLIPVLLAIMARAQTVNTRAEQIRQAQAEKAGRLEPETNSNAENRLMYIKDERVLERLTGGWNGLRLKLGGLAAAGGFAVGPEYSRADLANGNLLFRVSSQASMRRFLRHDLELTAPNLANGKLFLSAYAVQHNYPQLQFYGLGPDSQKTGLSNYRLEDFAVDGTVGIRPIKNLTIAGQSGFVMNNVGPGTKRLLISSDRQFPRVPGMLQQANFLRTGGYAAYDTRDIVGGPRSGGYYLFQFGDYRDTRDESLLGPKQSFRRFDAEVQQFIPFFNQRRVIALRGRTSMLDRTGRGEVPFYMMSTVGGPDTIRGYRPFRFMDRNTMVLNAEYRYEIFAGLDGTVFVDAGKATRRVGDLNFKNLESSVGFGFRVNARNAVFMRIETGFSHEGFQVWLRFNPVFRTGPSRTSSSQGEF
jgi:hypothetical protein